MNEETKNTETQETTFERLSKINVNQFTEKKGQFTYLSWAFALTILKKECPSAIIRVYEDVNTGLPYFTSSAGVLCKVGVLIDDQETICYLPAMDFKNKAIQAENVDMMQVNKTIQRCSVKAIAMSTGLGLYLYSGEDLPTATSQPQASQAPVNTEAKQETKEDNTNSDENKQVKITTTSNTYSIKDKLKENGFRWNKDAQGWSLIGKATELQKVLDTLPEFEYNIEVLG